MVDPTQGTLAFPAGSQAVDTSEDAADSLSPEFLSRLRLDVLAYVADRGTEGATADEIAAAWDCDHNHVAPRLTDLKDVGLVEVRTEPTPVSAARGHPRTEGKRRSVRRLTRKGRAARVHVVTRAGLRVLGRWK